MLGVAIQKRLGGIVINGAIRDVAAIRAQSLPVYAAGITHRGPYKDGPGEVNVPISLDDMVIEPGDLVIGDEDGLLCVPYADTDAVYAMAAEKHSKETASTKAFAEGTNDRSWVERQLREAGCEIEA